MNGLHRTIISAVGRIRFAGILQAIHDERNDISGVKCVLIHQIAESNDIAPHLKQEPVNGSPP